MKEKNTQPSSLYETWAELQALLEEGTMCETDHGLGACSMATPAMMQNSHLKPVSPSLAVTQLLQTAQIKPTAEVLNLLPQDVFVIC